MYRKSKKLLVWCLVVSMVLTQMLFTNIALAATPNAGLNRYETAAKVALAGWTTSDYAVLAYGEDFPDALAAAPLAAAYGAPILLTDKAGLDTYTKDALTKLGVKNVIIVGGEGVVPAAIATEVAAMANMNAPTRVFGTDRENTALAIAKAVEAKTGVAAADVFVVNSESYADALSISSLAAIAPISTIVLVGKDAVNADVAAYVNGKKAYVIGGTGVVSDAVVAQLKAERVTEGTDRYGTNLAVLKTFADFKFDKVFVATGENYPDALAGSVYAAKSGSPLVLVDQAITADTMAYLKTKMAATSAVYTLGGLAAVASAASALETTVNPPSTTLKVESVSALNLNEFEVKFNKEVDETIAETVTNYLVDGAALSNGLAPLQIDLATLQSDKKTVVVTMDGSLTQGQKAYVKVQGIYSKDLLEKTADYEKELTFFDTTVPTVKSVKASGNRAIEVEFAEAVRVPAGTVAWKMDNQSVTNYGYINETIAVAPGVLANNFARKVTLNFNVDLTVGAHSLNIPAGTGAALSDGAGFMLAEVNVPFTVSEDTARPTVVSVTAQNNGDMEITWSEKMGTSATTAGNYNVNGAGAGTRITNIKFKTGSDSKVVTFNSGDVLSGANVVEIDNDVADVYGNKLHADENQRYSFNAVKDTVAPTVSTVTMINNTTLRVKFSETVDNSYATTLSNYELKDSAGVAVAGVGPIVAVPTPGQDSDTYDITTPALTGSSYTLKIKNIIDLASPANEIAEVTKTIAGNDDDDPALVTIVQNYNHVAAAAVTTKATIYFDEAMNSADLTNKANYAYLDGAAPAKVRALPAGATLTVREGGKAVEIAFPSAYTINGVAGNQYDVIDIRVSNVKDLAGNALTDISSWNRGNVAGGNAIRVANNAAETALVGATVVTNGFKLSGTSTKLKAEVELNKTLSILNRNDFTVDGATPDTAYMSGKKVVLEFTTGASIAAIRAAGVASVVAAAVPTTTSDAAGVVLPVMAATTVYTETIAPVLVTADSVATDAADTVTLVFSEELYGDVLGDIKDDFTFAIGGALLTPTAAPTLATVAVTVPGAAAPANNALVYQFAANALGALGSNVTVKAIPTKISIKDMIDGADVRNAYVPTKANSDGFTLVTQ